MGGKEYWTTRGQGTSGHHRRATPAVAACLLLLCLSVQAEATTYYVRTDGANSPTCNGTANAPAAATPNCAWLNPDTAAAAPVDDGDTVRLQAGTYAGSITPTNAGSLGSPITFVADGAVNICGGVQLTDGDNYFRFIGITFDTNAGSCTIAQHIIVQTGTVIGIEFWNNAFQDATQSALTSGNDSEVDRAHNWIVIGNTFTRIHQVPCPCNARGISLRGQRNFFAHNSFIDVDPDVFFPQGGESFWLNNYVESTVTSPAHGDIFQSTTAPLDTPQIFNLIEANWFLGVGNSSDEHGMLLQDQGTPCAAPPDCGAIDEYMLRRNVWHNFGQPVGGGGDTSATVGILNTRNVHETYVENVRLASTTSYGLLVRNLQEDPIVNNAFLFNSIHYENWYPTLTTNILVFHVQNQPWAEWTAVNYNLAFDPDQSVTFGTAWNNQANKQTNVDPVFVDTENDDFHLQVTSGAIGNAGPLTATVGGGTGTTFSVATGTGGFFRGPNTDIDQYGGKLTEGDLITIGTDVRTVVSVSGDDITVDSSLTWADEDPVYYGDDTTPDIGAFPYKAGGYTLSATYVNSGGTVTVTPNDASLVRWVVCYDSGVPYAVDNTSPYTCTAPSGTLVARAYPRYASTTLYAEAQEAVIAGAVRLRIRP